MKNPENQKSAENQESAKNQKTKGISLKKSQANRENSARSTGPKSKNGKLWSRMNALKHGVFASELYVSDLEQPEFDLLHQALFSQLAPDSILRQVGFERVVVAFWRWKLALRLEMKQLKARLEFDENRQPRTDVPMESVLPTSWYGTNNKELRAGVAFLSFLLRDVEANGLVHAGDWKDPVIKAFGQKFYESLTEWQPINISAIQLSNTLIAHAANFNMPLPSSLAPELKNDQTGDPRLNLQMVVKIVDLMQPHLENLLRINGLGRDGRDQDQGAITLDLASRYVNTATRELERALNGYRDLKKQGL